MAHSDLVMLAPSRSALLLLSLAMATSTLTEPDTCELGGDAETDPTPICSLKDWTEPEFAAGLNHDVDNANVLELDLNVTQPQSGTDEITTRGELEATASDLYAMKDLTEEPPFIAEPLNMEEFLADVTSQEPPAPTADPITPALLRNVAPQHTTTIFLVDDEPVTVTPFNEQIQKPVLKRLNTKHHQRSVSFASTYQSASIDISDVDVNIDYAGFRFQDRNRPIPAAMTSPRFLKKSLIQKTPRTAQLDAQKLTKLEEQVVDLSKRCARMESRLNQVKDGAAQSPRTAVSTPVRDVIRVEPRPSNVTPQRLKMEPDLGKAPSPRLPIMRRSRSAQSVAAVAAPSPNNARVGPKAERSPQVAPAATPIRARTRMGPDGGSPRPFYPMLKPVPARSVSAKRSSMVATRK